MKITQELRPVFEQRTKEPIIVEGHQSPFQQTLGSAQKSVQTNQLEELLQRVEQQGKRVIYAQTLKDVAAYRQLVQSFIKKALDVGLQREQKDGWNAYGQHETMQLVKEVDQKLIALTDNVIGQERKPLALLEAIGEIQGLLINIYT
ncbi:hypothetical protein A374_16828 [Fictibacillus macauensis ZFHKF-1]|uniref:YaaR n=1 Tax=Fictibacillus macauensis ZFHKF-1 TaxID=1196324 RepID=I8AF07_9BACL|nr:YaaR family protein [Fictibacillus macauensis]EIT84207.1 hypothetical protein A374_16828 [Fictibacillus macauensis ZFHKF-1]